MNSKDIANYLLEDSGYLFEAKTKEKEAPTERPMTDEERKYFSDLRANKAAISDLEDQRAKIVVKGLSHSTSPEQEAKLADIRSKIKALEVARTSIEKTGLDLAAIRAEQNVVIKDEPDASERASFLDRHAKELEAIRNGEMTPKKGVGEREVIPGGQLPTKGVSLRKASEGPGFNAPLPATSHDKEKIRAVIADEQKGEVGVGDKKIKKVRTNIDPDLLVLATAHQINKDTVALYGRDSSNRLGPLFPHKRTAVAVLKDFVIPYEAGKIDVPNNISNIDEEFAAKIWKDIRADRNEIIKKVFKDYLNGSRVNILRNTDAADNFVEHLTRFVGIKNIKVTKAEGKIEDKVYYIPTYNPKIAHDLELRAKKLYDEDIENGKELRDKLVKEKIELQQNLIEEIKKSIKDDYMGSEGQKVSFKIAKLVKVEVAEKVAIEKEKRSRLERDTEDRSVFLAQAQELVKKAAESFTKSESEIDENMEEILSYINEADDPTPEPVKKFNNEEAAREARKLAAQKGVGSINTAEAKKKERDVVVNNFRTKRQQNIDRIQQNLDRQIKAMEYNERVTSVILNVNGITTEGKSFRMRVPWDKILDNNKYIDLIFSTFPSFEKVMSRNSRMVFSESEYSLRGTPEVTATITRTTQIAMYNKIDEETLVSKSSSSASEKEKNHEFMVNIRKLLNAAESVAPITMSKEDDKEHSRNISGFSNQLAAAQRDEENDEEKTYSAIDFRHASLGKNADVNRTRKLIFTVLSSSDGGSIGTKAVALLKRHIDDKVSPFRALTELTLVYDLKTGIAKDTRDTLDKADESNYGKLNKSIENTVEADYPFVMYKKGDVFKMPFTKILSSKFFEEKDDEGNILEGKGVVGFYAMDKEGAWINGSIDIESPKAFDLFSNWNKEKYLAMTPEERSTYLLPSRKSVKGVVSRKQLIRSDSKYKNPIKVYRFEYDKDEKKLNVIPNLKEEELEKLSTMTDKLTFMFKVDFTKMV